jgi:hypothetical protein
MRSWSAVFVIYAQRFRESRPSPPSIGVYGVYSKNVCLTNLIYTYSTIYDHPKKIIPGILIQYHINMLDMAIQKWGHWPYFSKS